MEEMVLAAERRGRGHLRVGGSGGGRDGGGVQGGGELAGTRGLAPPNPLRKKSVSFTRDESYELLRSGQEGVAPAAKDMGSGGGPGEKAVAMAPASIFFLRAGRTTSPMVTPHAAYALSAKRISQHSTSIAVAPPPGAAVGVAPVLHDHHVVPAKQNLGVESRFAASANVTPPTRTQLLTRAIPTAVVAYASAPAIVASGGLEEEEEEEEKKTPFPSRGTTTASDGRTDGEGGDRGVAAAAAAAIAATKGVGAPERGSEAQQRQQRRHERQQNQHGADTSLQRRVEEGETALRRGEERGHGYRVVSGEAERGGGGSGGVAHAKHELLRRALPSNGGPGWRGARAADEMGEGISRLERLAKTPPALYADVVDTQVEDEDEEEEEAEGEEGEGDGGEEGEAEGAEEEGFDDDEDDGHEVANNDSESSPCVDGRNGSCGGTEAYEIGHSHTAMHGSGGGGGGGGSGDGSGAAQQEQEHSWSAIPGPRSRGKRSKWDIGDRYRFIRTLGRGSYGEVAQCEDLKDGGLVAIKRVLNVFNSEADAKRIYREMYILRHMRHNEIIHLRDVLMPATYGDFRDLYLVFEFVDTDLFKLIRSPQFLTDEHVKLFLYQMLIGLKYVHSAHVIHRDMKPANVLLNEDCSVKVCDFGLSRVVTQEPSTDPVRPPANVVMSTKAGKLACSPMKESTSAAGAADATSHAAAAGGGSGSPRSDEEPSAATPQRTLKRQLTKHVVTRWYRAPELILLQDYNNAVDMWSLGCILAELLSMQKESFATSQERHALFPGKSCFPLSAEKPSSYSDALDQLNVIFDVIGTPCKEDIKDLGEVRQYLARLAYKPPLDLSHKYVGASALALDLLSRMLRFNPARRITIAEALEHPYLASCRRPEKEVTASVPITMEFEHTTTPKSTLKRLIYEEVLHYHPDQAAQFKLVPPVLPVAAAATKTATTSPATELTENSHRQHRQQQQQQQQQVLFSRRVRDVGNADNDVFNRNANANGDGDDLVLSRPTRSYAAHRLGHDDFLPSAAAAPAAACSTAAKRPAGAIVEHQEPENKRQRLATGTCGNFPRRHAVPTAEMPITTSACDRRPLARATSAVEPAAAAAATAAAAASIAAAGKNEWSPDADLEGGGGGENGGTKRPRGDCDFGYDYRPPAAPGAPAGGVSSALAEFEGAAAGQRLPIKRARKIVRRSS